MWSYWWECLNVEVSYESSCCVCVRVYVLVNITGCSCLTTNLVC